MGGDGGNGADLDVARRRHLEMDPVVEHVAGERTEPQFAVVADRRVGLEPDSVADAMRAVDDGVGDQLEVGWLAGVDRDVEVPLAGERQGLGVERRRPAGLGAGEVEGDHLVVDRRLASTKRAISSDRCSVRIAQQMALTVIA